MHSNSKYKCTILNVVSVVVVVRRKIHKKHHPLELFFQYDNLLRVIHVVIVKPPVACETVLNKNTYEGGAYLGKVN